MPFIRLTHRYENLVIRMCLNFAISWKLGVVFSVAFSLFCQGKVRKLDHLVLCFSLDWNTDQMYFHICRYDDTGFKINNVKYEGSLLIVENKIMTWAPKTFSEITAER